MPITHAPSRQQSGQGGMQPTRERGQTTFGGVERSMSPFSLFRRMMEDMDRVFGGPVMGGAGLGPIDDLTQAIAGPTSLSWSPPVEVLQRDGNLVVRADLPGLDPEDVRVEVDDEAITIAGERRARQEEKREGYFVSERSYGSFVRQIPLPRGVDRNNVEATFENGVLEVTLKLPAASSQSIPIRGASARAGTLGQGASNQPRAGGTQQPSGQQASAQQPYAQQTSAQQSPWQQTSSQPQTSGQQTSSQPQSVQNGPAMPR
jgi:HSP20 family protein